jgi:hypothetical protein
MIGASQDADSGGRLLEKLAQLVALKFRSGALALFASIGLFNSLTRKDLLGYFDGVDQEPFDFAGGSENGLVDAIQVRVLRRAVRSAIESCFNFFTDERNARAVNLVQGGEKGLPFEFRIALADRFANEIFRGTPTSHTEASVVDVDPTMFRADGDANRGRSGHEQVAEAAAEPRWSRRILVMAVLFNVDRNRQRRDGARVIQGASSVGQVCAR